jgi:hypothetical protein
MDLEDRLPAMDLARSECHRLIDDAGRRMGYVGSMAERFTIEAFWDRDLRINFRRDPSRIERQACRIESGPLRWDGGCGHADAAAEHVERIMRVDRRLASGLRTWESSGDPLWSLSVHRAVATMLEHSSIAVRHLRTWTDIGDMVRKTRGISVDHVVVDAGRVHPLSIGNVPRGDIGVRLSATILAHDIRTCVQLPGIRWPLGIMEDAAGRTLGEIITAPGLDPSCVVRRIDHDDAWGTRIVLEHDDIALEEPPKSAASERTSPPPADIARRAA